MWGKSKSRFFPIVFFAFFILSFFIINPAFALESGPASSMAGAGGFSSSQGTANISHFTGAATYAVPIAVPPGRLGVAPNISIGYSSQGGGGWIGVGWGLDLGSIQLNPRDGIDYGEDDFVYSKGGSGSELVPVQTTDGLCANEYRSKVEDGSFIRFCFDGSAWTAYDKNGMKYFFGKDTLSRLDNPANPSQIFQWKLYRVEDANGNYMEISYEKDQGQIYLKQIDYTGNVNTGLQPTNRVVFNLDATRTDVYPTFALNFQVVTAKRLGSIVTYAQDELGVLQVAANYVFSYTNSGITGRSVLQKVQRYGTEGGALPETVFQYNDEVNESTAVPYFDASSTGLTFWVRVHDDDPEKDNGSFDVQRLKPADFNGDGKTDFLYIGMNYPGDSRIYLSAGNSFLPPIPLPFAYSVWDRHTSMHEYNMNRFLFGDFNGDGTTDLLFIDRSTTPTSTLYLSLVDSETGDLTFSAALPGPNFNPYTDACAQNDYVHRFKPGDFNGDGKTDILFIEGGDGAPVPSSIYLATGSGQDITFTHQMNGPSFTLHGMLGCGFFNIRSAAGNKAELQRVRIADFNGDGKSDIHYVRGSDASTPSHIYFASVDNAGAVSFGTAVNGPSFYITSYVSDGTDCGLHFYVYFDLGRIRYGDFNGDKKTDILRINANAPSDIYLATGDRGSPFSVLAGHGPSFSMHSAPYQVLMLDLSRIKTGDFNGDGRTDLLRVDGWSAIGASEPLSMYLSNGNGFRPPLRTQHGFTVNAIPYFEDCAWLASVDVNRFIFGDFRGSGRTDFLYLPGLHPYNEPTRLYTARPDVSDVIKKVQTPDGGEKLEITLTYGLSTDYRNHVLPFSLPVLTDLTVDPKNPAPAHNAVSITSYAYEDGYFDNEDREFRGFGKVIQTNPDGSVLKTWFHQRDMLDVNNNYVDDEDFKGKVRYTEFWDSDENLLSTTTMKWARSVPKPIPNDESAYPVFVKVTEKDITSTIGGVTVSSHEEYTYDDGNGTVLSVFTSGPDAEDIITTNTYDKYGSWLWRKTGTTVTGSASGKVRETTFEYEQGTGSLLWKKFWLAGVAENDYPKVSMTYTAEGNLETQTDALGHVTYTGYDDATKTYPELMVYPQTNGVDHYAGFQYDKRFGIVRYSVDENGNYSENILDEFGRTVETRAYVGEGPDIAAKTKTEYHVAEYPAYVKSSVLESNDPVEVFIDKYDFFDGLGRKIQSIGLGENNQTVVVNARYDEMGRAYRSEGPFFSTAGFVYTANLPADYPWSETTFDFLGRPTTVTGRDEEHGLVSSEIQYAGLSTTAIDADGKKKTERRDYLGRIYEVVEYGDNNEPYITRYDYNAAGDLLTVTDAASPANITTVTYDTLGRKTKMIDPDMGTWYYCYEPNGNLKKQIDAKGQIIDFLYDALNRVETKTYAKTEPQSLTDATACSTTGAPIPGGHPVYYTYDNINVPNGSGRLWSVDNNQVRTEVNAYDSLGNVISSTKAIDGNPNSYTTYTFYDLAGRLTTMTYPDGYRVTYDYEQGTGFLRSITGTDGIKTVQYASFPDYGVFGQINQIHFGNGTKTGYTFDAFSAKLTGIVTETPSPTGDPADDILYQGYQYTKAGDLRKVIDYKKASLPTAVGGYFEYTYDYDSLHRLKSERSPELLGETMPGDFTYDPHPTIAHAFQSITTVDTNDRVVNPPYDFTYDANGNMTEGWDLRNIREAGFRKITWNADNKPAGIDYNGATTTFVYDGGGGRAKKIGNSDVTYYIGVHFEVVNGENIKYIFAGGLRIAKIEPSETYYYHKDRLGSTIGMSNEQGILIWTTNYLPYGGQREETFLANLVRPTNYLYTDQEFDPETGLYNYGARLYDCAIGKFVSPDSIIPSLFSPQSLNRYAYALNNPLRYIDPSGHDPISFIIGTIIVSAIVGGVSAGIQSNWDVGAMLQGAFLGGVVGGIGAGFGVVIGEIVTVTLAGAATGATAGGCVTTGFLASGSTLATAISTAGGIAGGVVGGAVSGSMSSAMYGGDIGKGALNGGLTGLAAVASTGFNLNIFGNSLTNRAANIFNRIGNSALTGAAFGAAYAGLTGDDILQGAATGALLWSAGEAANMLIGHTLGHLLSGKTPSFPEDGGFYYYTEGENVFTVGGAIIGNKDKLFKGNNIIGGVADLRYKIYEHELAHFSQQTVLSVSYIPLHLLSQGMSSIFTFGDRHSFNLLERSLIGIPSY